MSGHVNDHILDTVGRGHINDGLYKFFGGGASPLDPDATFGFDFAVDRSLVDSVGGIPLTFTRNSIGWHYNSAGLLVEAAIDEPRFDYNQSTLLSLGLLIEEARTNLALWSRNGAQTGWAKVGMDAVQNQVGITGTAASATLLTATAPNATLLQTVVGAATNRSFSIFLRRITGNGQVEISGDAFTGALPVLLTSSWQRFEVLANVLDPQFGIRLSVSGDEVAMDVAQLEEGVVPTSPIITAASTVTRGLEACSTTDMSWYNLAAGTTYIRQTQAYDIRGWMYSISTSIATERIESAYRNDTIQSIRGYITGSGTGPILDAVVASRQDSNKSAMAYQANDFEHYANGVREGAGIQVVTMPAQPTIFHLGAGSSGGDTFNGHIAVFVYADVRKDNVFLQDVTT